MTYVLNDATTIPADKVETRTGRSFWQRLYTAMIESRRRSALRQMRARHFLTSEAEIMLGGFPQSSLLNDAKLPFNR